MEDFKYFTGVTITTKFDFTVMDVRQKRYRGTATLDLAGMRNHQVDIRWADYTPDIQQVNVMGNVMLVLRLVNNTNPHKLVAVYITPKQYYLIKNLSGYDIPYQKEVEEWLEFRYRLRKATAEDLAGAQIFKPRIILSGVVLGLLVVGISAGIGGLAAWLKWNTSFVIPVAILVIMPLVWGLSARLPRGKVYITKYNIICRTPMQGDQVIPMDKAQVSVGRFIIQIRSSTHVIRIWKTRRAIAWLQHCKF